MSQARATRSVIVANPGGLHARAATMIAGLINGLDAVVELVKGDERVDGTNVLQILTLCAHRGEELRLEAVGREADAALDALVELFENQFGESESPEQQKQKMGEA